MKPAAPVAAGAAAAAVVAGSNAPQPLPLQVPEPGKISPSRYEAIASLDTEENEAEIWAGKTTSSRSIKLDFDQPFYLEISSLASCF